MQNKKKIYFRADASAEIGYGHFIRSLALAEMLKDDFDCTFYTQEPTDFQRSEISKVCKLTELPSDDSKFDLFLESLSGDEIVVLDNYFYTSEYEKKIKDVGCKLVSIGTNDRYYYADVVVNFTNLTPSDFVSKKYTRFCIGLDWFILRKSFYQPSLSKFKCNVVICIGGTDQFQYSEKFYDAIIKHYPKRHIQIVSTDKIGKERIEKFYQKNVDLRLNLTSDAITEILSEAHIVIASASTIAVEALARGANVIAGYYVDNQLNIYSSLCAERYIWGIGNLGSSDCIERMLQCITAISCGEKRKRFEAINTVSRYKQLFRGLCS